MQQEPQPMKAEVNTVRPIGRSVSLDIYRQFLDNGLYDKTTGHYGGVPPEATQSKANEILPRYVDEIKKRIHDYNVKTESLVVPENFDMSAEARAATQRVIQIALSSEILDLQQIRAAGKYVGVSNTKVVPELDEYALRTTPEYDELVKAHGGGVLSRPDVGNHRNVGIVLELGGRTVRNMAAEFMKSAAAVGVPLTIEQALRLELTRGTAHEYGHGLEYGLKNLRILPRTRAAMNKFMRAENLLYDRTDYVHGEHFARGFEQMITKRYMQEELHLTPEQVDKFYKQQYKEGRELAEDAFNFLDYATQKGLIPGEIIGLQRTAEYAVMAGFNEREGLRGVHSMIAYDAEPYTEGQMKVLISTELTLPEKTLADYAKTP